MIAINANQLLDVWNPVQHLGLCPLHDRNSHQAVAV